MTTPRRALHVTTVHAPRDPRIFEKECRALAAAGWDVMLLAPGANDDSVDGVRIRSITPRRGRLARMTLMAMDVLRQARRSPAEVVHVHDPELVPAALLLRASGRCVVYDAHEDLPRQIRGKPWVPRWARLPVSAASTALLRAAGHGVSAIVAATEAVAEGFPPPKTIVVHNYPDIHRILPEAEPQLPYTDRPPDLVYAGGISSARGLSQMLDAMERLPRSTGARLHLAGRFQPTALAEAVERHPASPLVRQHGWLAPPGLAGLLGRVRIGICVLHPLPNYVESLPTKLFEYMAAGLPVIASDFAPWREIVEGAQCGILVDPLDVDAIGAAIERLLGDPDAAGAMGLRGRAAVFERYSWDREAAKLTALYDSLVSEADD